MAHTPATGRTLCYGASAESFWSKRNKSSVPTIAKTWALVACYVVGGSRVLTCFAAPSTRSHLCSREAGPCCHLGWLSCGTAVLSLEDRSAGSPFSVYIQRSIAGYVFSLLFLVMWSMWRSFFHLNCLPTAGKEGGYWLAANTDPSLFFFLVILIKYKEETAFLLKRRDHEQALPGQHWCRYRGAKRSCHVVAVNWSGLMTLKLGTSPTTEEPGCLFSLQIFSCKQLAIILVHWSLKVRRWELLGILVSSSCMVLVSVSAWFLHSHVILCWAGSVHAQEDFACVPRLFDIC